MTVAELLVKAEIHTHVWVSDVDTGECYAKGYPGDLGMTSPYYPIILLDLLGMEVSEFEVPGRNELMIRVKGGEII